MQTIPAISRGAGVCKLIGLVAISATVDPSLLADAATAALHSDEKCPKVWESLACLAGIDPATDGGEGRGGHCTWDEAVCCF